MTNKTRKWIRSGIEVLIHGGTAAIVSTIAAASIDSKDWAYFTPNFWKMLGSTFMGTGVVRFFQWWSNNPLPPESDSNPPFPSVTPVVSLNPLTKVQAIPKDELTQK